MTPAQTATTPLRARVACDGHRVQQVLRAIGNQRGSRAHRAGQHDGLGRGQQRLQEERGFLQRIGAMGDDDALDIGLRQVMADARGQLGPDAKLMSLLSICATCSVSTVPACASAGIAASSSSTPTWAAV
jgi:hypothetical protein